CSGSHHAQCQQRIYQLGQVSEMNVRQVSEMNVRQVSEMNVRQVSEESARQVPVSEVSKEDVRQVSEEGVRQVSEEDVRHGNEEGVRQVSEESLRQVSEEDVRHVSEERVRQVREESETGIKHIVKAAEPVPREQAHLIQKKMERCRNQENNPESEVYKTKMADLFDDEEETRSQKRARRDEEQIVTYFLTVAEERLLVRQYEFVLKEFWNKFQPPAPKCILGTSLAFFKRFWVNNSVMDYHPKDIMLTCVYLACKVEEFYVPIGQFVSNLKGNREKFADTILAFELLLLSKLHYQLTVHHPFRPLEGLLIDIKTRLPELDNPERLRKTAEEFIDKCLMTDVILIFAPSQIALAAIMHSASKESINLDRYVTEVLMCGSSQEEVQKCIYQLRRIKHIVKAAEPVPREQAHLIQKKMERCRNQENNPESEVYKTKMADLFDDEEETRSQKRARRDVSVDVCRLTYCCL
ncbi:hypothetical protein BaRGS_00035536, partial [Batillaria attramentaria]